MEYKTKSSSGKYGKKPSYWPPKVFALTGIPGAGKSTLAKILSSAGILVIDTDTLAREAAGKDVHLLVRLEEAAGSRILLPDGSLDRALLRHLMSQDKKLKRKVEGIIHPIVFHLLDQKLKEAARNGVKIAVIEVPLLFEAGWDSCFDGTICITAPEGECIKRIAKRNGISEKEAAKWLSMQMDQAEKMSRADYVISNNGTLEELKTKAGALISRLKEMTE